MSEQKVSFMQELDRWTDENVIQPFLSAQKEAGSAELSEEGRDEKVAQAMDAVRTAIRQKVLQSFRNGRMTRGTPPAKLPVPKRQVRA